MEEEAEMVEDLWLGSFRERGGGQSGSYSRLIDLCITHLEA